jgi:hypothetical protein
VTLLDAYALVAFQAVLQAEGVPIVALPGQG